MSILEHTPKSLIKSLYKLSKPDKATSVPQAAGANPLGSAAIVFIMIFIYLILKE